MYIYIYKFNDHELLLMQMYNNLDNQIFKTFLCSWDSSFNIVCKTLCRS
jgi:hypothetical protein